MFLHCTSEYKVPKKSTVLVLTGILVDPSRAVEEANNISQNLKCLNLKQILQALSALNPKL